MENLTVTASPHERGNASTAKIMTDVIIALIPALLMAGFIFGGRALMITGFCMICAMALERICNLVMKRENSVGDLSAAVTGMLLAFNLPVTISYWQAFLGVFIAIVIVKQLFGGLGHNFANPAIVGRIVLMLSFPAAMTNWAVPFYDSKAIETGATPLAVSGFTYQELFLGNIGGCIGEISKAALLIGALYLIARGVITPAAPIAFIGTVFCFSTFTGHDGLYQILSGGLFLGAFFMATDYVTTPITFLGKAIFGLGCGIITCLIRFYASYPEGVSFSILIMNIVTPIIDMLTIRVTPLAKKTTKEEA
ncbi:MAG: RnfABCDGE type electron transport complex subunit D [Ruminococcus sp.]|nr:RnfABCDGE type electron transport complex subunit D [Ruminococcus sp.]